MIYSAQQIADAIGPDDPDCGCTGCQAIIEMKALICDAVTDFDTRALAKRTRTGENVHAGWLTVLYLAAHRAAAQGFTPDTIGDAVTQGYRQAHALNPALHTHANTLPV